MTETPGTDSGYATMVIVMELVPALIKKGIFTPEEISSIFATLAERESKSTEAAGKRVAPFLRKLSERQF